MAVPPRLVERFGRSPLAVVAAPAGFGKTTLLQSWWDRIGDTPKTLVSFDTFRRPNALDAGHAHVRGLTAIGLSPPVADELVALVPPDAKSFGDAFVDAVVNEVRALPNEFVLFFDDAHGLVLEAASDLGRIVAMVATDDHRVVVATRGEPPWPIHRWRMSGLADVVSADDLRLTADEVAEMLGPEMAAFATRVAPATGGWAAAVEAVRCASRSIPPSRSNVPYWISSATCAPRCSLRSTRPMSGCSPGRRSSNPFPRRWRSLSLPTTALPGCSSRRPFGSRS